MTTRRVTSWYEDGTVSTSTQLTSLTSSERPSKLSVDVGWQRSSHSSPFAIFGSAISSVAARSTPLQLLARPLTTELSPILPTTTSRPSLRASGTGSSGVRRICRSIVVKYFGRGFSHPTPGVITRFISLPVPPFAEMSSTLTHDNRVTESTTVRPSGTPYLSNPPATLRKSSGVISIRATSFLSILPTTTVLKTAGTDASPAIHLSVDR